MRLSLSLNAAATLLAVSLTGACGEIKLLTSGDTHTLRERPTGARKSSPSHPGLLVLCLDGVDRALLYDMLRKGEMPGLAALLGTNAYFDETLLATLPSSTMAAWATAFTGVTPSHHGIAGNEFFIREERRFAAPAPGTFTDHESVLAIYTDQYLNKLLLAPTVYQRMRLEDPSVLVWVAMQQIYGGADRLLVTKPVLLVTAFESYVEVAVTRVASATESRVMYERLDRDAMSVVVSALDGPILPDVLTVYLSGTDLYAHVAAEGPDVSRRAYLHEVVDEEVKHLTAKLRERGALANRYVVVTSDHGHTQVVADDAHALAASGDHSPATVLKKIGFRVRPFKLDVPKTDDFQAVLAYQGAMAYVYVADRSTCNRDKQACNWALPPRYDDDVVPVAEAFFKNNDDGSIVAGLQGTLDMVLTRRPRPYTEDDLPFEVYIGHGKTVPVEQYLAATPHPTYVDVASRLRDLAVGPHGERAGDVLLLAHNGDRETPQQRYYFATPYQSWHGSPSRKDSEIPLIVACPERSTSELGALVHSVFGDHPHQEKITDLLLALRRTSPGK